VHSVNQIPVIVLHVLKRDISQDSRVVDQDIDAAKVLNGSINNSLSVLHAIVVGDGFAASLADFFNDNIGGLQQKN
jgi:hypothetical protein